ncbi:unnamed protein product [Lampetra fluviatilis]
MTTQRGTVSMHRFWGPNLHHSRPLRPLPPPTPTGPSVPASLRPIGNYLGQRCPVGAHCRVDASHGQRGSPIDPARGGLEVDPFHDLGSLPGQAGGEQI